MPPFLSRAALHEAVDHKAIPALERLAADPNLRDRSLRRFDRDEPPCPSSDSEDDCPLYHPAFPRPSEAAVIAQHRDLLAPPLTEDELGLALHELRDLYSPRYRYNVEAEQEEQRIFRFERTRGFKDELHNFVVPLKYRGGHQWRDIVARHNVRKRWQKLGIWNAAWGIPGRPNKQPSDDTSEWRWSWQHGEHSAPWQIGPLGSLIQPPRDSAALNAQHPTARAMKRRLGIPGEHTGDTPVLSPSHVGDGTSPDQAESFITSRPWFTYRMDVAERTVRLRRIPFQQAPITYRPAMHVMEAWEERGDWSEKDENTGRPGWKWKHESPSPEPEDLQRLNTDKMDFTPSEIDALESIPPLSPYIPPYLSRDWSNMRKPGERSLFDTVSSSPSDQDSLGQRENHEMEVEEETMAGLDCDGQVADDVEMEDDRLDHGFVPPAVVSPGPANLKPRRSARLAAKEAARHANLKPRCSARLAAKEAARRAHSVQPLPSKRGRGRPRKGDPPASKPTGVTKAAAPRKRGRPPKRNAA